MPYDRCERAKTILSTPLPFPQRQCGCTRASTSCHCFQVYSLNRIYVLFSSMLPCGKNILHSGSSTVHKMFTAFLHRLPPMGSNVTKPKSSAQKDPFKEYKVSSGQPAFVKHLW